MPPLAFSGSLRKGSSSSAAVSGWLLGRAPRFWAGFGQESEGAEASRGAVSLPGAWVQAWVGEPAGGVPLVLRFLRLLSSVQLTHPRYYMSCRPGRGEKD